MGILLKLGIAILIGMIGGRAANRFKLPSVSGYIIAGLILGPSFFNILTSTDVDSLNIINDMALAAIAYGIGNEFLVSDIKKIGKDAFIMTVGEVIGAVLAVFAVMYFIFNQTFIFSMIIASMSAATAPAGLVMVVNELKADGPLVRTMLPVTAFDDALGIMIFGVSISVAQTLKGSADFSLISIIGNPLLQIVGALILGFIVGLIMTYICCKIKCPEKLLMATVGFIFLGVGLSKYLNVSELLTCMVMGATTVNSTHRSKRIFSSLASITPPINVLFFTVAGASIDLKVLSTVGIMGLGYILARAAGKIIGATLSAKAVGADETIVKYLGMSLLTQGGISIGLSMTVKSQMPELGDSLITVILFSVLVFEILGPILANIAIRKAGEVNGRVKA